MTEEGWNVLLYEFAMMSREKESGADLNSDGDPAAILRPLLALTVPDPFHKTQPGSIVTMEEIYTTRCPEAPAPKYYFNMPSDGGGFDPVLDDQACDLSISPCCWRMNSRCQGSKHVQALAVFVFEILVINSRFDKYAN